MSGKLLQCLKHANKVTSELNSSLLSELIEYEDLVTELNDDIRELRDFNAHGQVEIKDLRKELNECKQAELERIATGVNT